MQTIIAEGGSIQYHNEAEDIRFNQDPKKKFYRTDIEYTAVKKQFLVCIEPFQLYKDASSTQIHLKVNETPTVGRMDSE